jgi:hypothetical protein
LAIGGGAALAARHRWFSSQSPQPAVDFALSLVSRHAVALLQSACELGSLALDKIEIVVRDLTPLLLNPAPELIPIPFDPIPVHGSASCRLDLLRVGSTSPASQSSSDFK